MVDAVAGHVRTLSGARRQPGLRRIFQKKSTIAFMMALSFINYLGFAGWSALLYNFTVERAGFNWAEAGITQSVREIPGFLAFKSCFRCLVKSRRDHSNSHIGNILFGDHMILVFKMLANDPLRIAFETLAFIFLVSFYILILRK